MRGRHSGLLHSAEVHKMAEKGLRVQSPESQEVHAGDQLCQEAHPDLRPGPVSRRGRRGAVPGEDGDGEERYTLLFKENSSKVACVA